MHYCDRHDLRSFGWWVGKSSATRRQPAMLWKERLWILAHLPDHNILACRSGAPAAEQPRINGMALWPVGNLLWPILGALAYSTA